MSQLGIKYLTSGIASSFLAALCGAKWYLGLAAILLVVSFSITSEARAPRDVDKPSCSRLENVLNYTPAFITYLSDEERAIFPQYNITIRTFYVRGRGIMMLSYEENGCIKRSRFIMVTDFVRQIELNKKGFHIQ